MEMTGEQDSTIIALWSDHGHQLGDHVVQYPLQNFGRIPFILVDPRVAESGQRVSARVELIDIFQRLPTCLDCRCQKM